MVDGNAEPETPAPSAHDHARPKPSPSTAGFLLALVVVTLVAGAVRLHDLGEASFWRDEIFTVRDTDRTLADFGTKWLAAIPARVALRTAGVDTSDMQLDTSWRWREMGVTEWNARIASALIGVLSVPLLALAVRPLFGSGVAILVAALLALDPWHVYWSQTARFYSQQLLLYNLALLAYLAATERRSPGLLLAAVASAALAVLTQTLAALLALVLAADWLLARLRGRPIWLGRVGWSLAAIAALGGGAFFLREWVLGPSDFDFFLRNVPPQPVQLGARLLFAMGPAVVALSVLGAPYLLRRDERRGSLLLLAAGLPVAAIAAMELGLKVAPRYAHPALFAWLLAAAVLLEAMRASLAPRVGALLSYAPAAVVLVVMAAFVFPLERNASGYNRPWRAAFEYVNAHREPGDWTLSESPTGPYYTADPDHVPVGPSYRKYLGEVESVESALARADAGGERAWIVLSGRRPFRGPERQLVAGTELREAFVRPTGTPVESVFVYLRHPRGPEREGSGSSAEGARPSRTGTPGRSEE